MTVAMILRGLPALSAAGVVAFTSSPVSASSFQVTPITVSVPHDRPIGAITVRNEEDGPVSIRVLTLRWTQRDGEEIYSATDELLASPPIFTLKPKGTQLIRVGLRKNSDDGEAAYRIILEEIPQAAGDSRGIRIALRLNLPFYKEPKGKAAPAVRWTAQQSRGGALRIEAANSGALHEQINRIDALDAAGKRFTLVGKPSVVLPGSSKAWTITEPSPVTALSALKLIVVKPGGEEDDAALAVQTR